MRAKLGRVRTGFHIHDPGNHKRVVYTPADKLSNRAAEAEAMMAKRRSDVDRLLDLLAPLSTAQCGLLATAYTAWNDLLLAGRPAGDRDVIRDVRHHWHQSKRTFPTGGGSERSIGCGITASCRAAAGNHFLTPSKKRTKT